MSVLDSYHLVNTKLQARAVSSEHFPHVWVYLTLDKVATAQRRQGGMIKRAVCRDSLEDQRECQLELVLSAWPCCLLQQQRGGGLSHT